MFSMQRVAFKPFCRVLKQFTESVIVKSAPKLCINSSLRSISSDSGKTLGRTPSFQNMQSTKKSTENMQSTKKSTELEEFDKQFETVLKILLSSQDYSQYTEQMDWYKKVLEYNVPHGKKIRGVSMVKAYKVLCEGQPDLLTDENIQKAQLIGWAIELLQAYFLIIDDVMDQSVTRRGQPCWYKLDGVRLVALNDAELVQQGIYVLLKHAAQDKPYYMDLVDLFHKITMKTSLGQSMDSRTASIDHYNMQRYSTIVKLKTAYYTTCLPILAALYTAGITDPNTHKIAEDILLQMGHFFQVQDDFLDCFGDPSVTGKVGTDIEDKKCAWPLVTALPLASHQQLEILLTNYGKHEAECVGKVKKVYTELDVKGLYHKYEEESYKKLTSAVKENANILLQQAFMGIIDKLYKRKS